MTETEPGPWLHALLMLVGCNVMSWRFFSPPLVHAQDDLPDGVLDLTNAAGNHVIIDNGHELIALAHLRQSTVAVRTGTSVLIYTAAGTQPPAALPGLCGITCAIARPSAMATPDSGAARGRATARPSVRRSSCRSPSAGAESTS